MSSYHIPNITIKEFRGIRKLSLQDLGKVNIITGENGSGTTSVLEAIHLYTGGASPEIVKEIIDSRAESPGQHRGNGESLTDFLALNSMFWGFPQAPHSPDPISITTGRKMPPHVVQMQLKLLTEITDDHRMRKLVQSQPNPAVDPQDVPPWSWIQTKGPRTSRSQPSSEQVGRRCGNASAHTTETVPPPSFWDPTKGATPTCGTSWP